MGYLSFLLPFVALAAWATPYQLTIQNDSACTFYIQKRFGPPFPSGQVTPGTHAYTLVQENLPGALQLKSRSGVSVGIMFKSCRAPLSPDCRVVCTRSCTVTNATTNHPNVNIPATLPC